MSETHRSGIKPAHLSKVLQFALIVSLAAHSIFPSQRVQAVSLEVLNESYGLAADTINDDESPLNDGSDSDEFINELESQPDVEKIGDVGIEGLDYLAAAIAAGISPQEIEDYLREMVRHITNRANNDAAHREARDCYMSDIEEAIRNVDLGKFMDMGAQIFPFGDGSGLFVVINGFVIVFGQHKGEIRNNGTAYKITKPNFRVGGKVNNVPLSREQVNQKFIDLMAGRCKGNPVVVPVPEAAELKIGDKKQNEKTSSMDFGDAGVPAATLLALVLLAASSVAIMSKKGLSGNPA